MGDGDGRVRAGLLSRGRPFDAEHQHEGFGRGRPLGGVFVQAAFRDFAQGAAELPEVRFVVDDSLDYGFQGAVAERAGCDEVLAAGDSLLDVDLLLAADRAIHPRHGELHEQGWSAPTVISTGSAGIAAGEEIVRWFAAQL